jgi:hypothetical protein
MSETSVLKTAGIRQSSQEGGGKTGFSFELSAICMRATLPVIRMNGYVL